MHSTDLGQIGKRGGCRLLHCCDERLRRDPTTRYASNCSCGEINTKIRAFFSLPMAPRLPISVLICNGTSASFIDCCSCCLRTTLNHQLPLCVWLRRMLPQPIELPRRVSKFSSRVLRVNLWVRRQSRGGSTPGCRYTWRTHAVRLRRVHSLPRGARPRSTSR